MANTLQRAIAISVPFVLVAAGVVLTVLWASSRSGDDAAGTGGQDRSDADPATTPESPGAREYAALAQACAALAQATPETIVERWNAVRRAFRSVIEATRGARELADWSSWFELHKVEGVVTACGIHGETARAHLAMLVQSPPLATAIRDERRALCAVGASLAEAGAETPWTEDVRTTWHAACVQFFSGVAISPAPSPSGSGRASASAPAAKSCPSIEELAAQRSAMVDRSLDRDAWLAFGRMLAECSPKASPWVQLELAGERQQFVDDYVVPFINGDLARGSWFQEGDSARYERIVAVWLEGG